MSGVPRHLGTRLAASCVRRPRTTLVVALAVAALALTSAVLFLDVRTSNLDLVDPHHPEVARFLDVAETFGTPNVLVVVLESDQPARLREAIDRVGPALADVPGARAVFDRMPIPPPSSLAPARDPYLTSRDGGMAFVFVQPEDARSSAESIEPFVRGVESRLRDADLEELGVEAGLTGMPRYALDDRDVIQHDVARLSLVSGVLVLALFVFGFGSLRRPLAAMAALAVAVVIMAGVVAVVPGHLTLLSAFFASILFGLGVDFGIHLVERFEETRADLRLGGDHTTPRAAVVLLATGRLARSLTTGALTTAAAFFSMWWSGFRGFEELGLVAGLGILVCLLATFTVLPALLTLQAPRRDAPVLLERRGLPLGRWIRAGQHPVVAVALAVAAMAGLAAGAPAFDTDYLNLQPRASETVRLERAMAGRSDWSPEFAVLVAADRDDAVAKVEALRKMPAVAAVRSHLDLELLQSLGATVDDDLRRLFRADDGRYALYAYPKGDIWRPDELRRFLDPIESLDPGVTGMPVLGRFMVGRSLAAMHRTAVLAGGLLLLCVAADFRRPLPTLLAVLPAFLTAGSLHGLMRLFGIAYNPLDVLALPIVLGIAVDDGVHLVHRFLDERGDLPATLQGTGRSIVLTSLTTMAAFGALVLTRHRGLGSFAACLSLGVASALVLSVFLLPQILRLLAPRLLDEPAGAPEPMESRA